MIELPQNLGALEREPGQIRPPFDRPWTRFEQHPNESTDSWRQRLRENRTAALLEPLKGIDLGTYDRRIVEFLAGWEDSTVATIASWIYRAREAGRAEAGDR